jgi:hypothetical protein
VEDQWELIDRKKDPLEMENVYNDPAYAQIKRDLHSRLEQLRKKYHDNTGLSQGYIDKFMEDASNGKVFGVSQEKVEAIKARRTQAVGNR